MVIFLGMFVYHRAYPPQNPLGLGTLFYCKDLYFFLDPNPPDGSQGHPGQGTNVNFNRGQVHVGHLSQAVSIAGM